MVKSLLESVIPFVVRMGLTVVLLYGAYGEAGPFTAVSLGCIFAGVELHTFQHRAEAVRKRLFGQIEAIRASTGTTGGL